MVLQKAYICILMQRSPYGQLPLFLLYKMQCSGLSLLGGGGLVSVNLCELGGNGGNGSEERRGGRCVKDGRGWERAGEVINFGQS